MKKVITLLKIILLLSTGAFASFEKEYILVMESLSFSKSPVLSGSSGSELPFTTELRSCANESFESDPYTEIYSGIDKQVGFKVRFDSNARSMD